MTRLSRAAIKLCNMRHLHIYVSHLEGPRSKDYIISPGRGEYTSYSLEPYEGACSYSGLYQSIKGIPMSTLNGVISLVWTVAHIMPKNEHTHDP